MIGGCSGSCDMYTLESHKTHRIIPHTSFLIHRQFVEPRWSQGRWGFSVWLQGAFVIHVFDIFDVHRISAHAHFFFVCDIDRQSQHT